MNLDVSNNSFSPKALTILSKFLEEFAGIKSVQIASWD
jgi:hypothetical protein